MLTYVTILRQQITVKHIIRMLLSCSEFVLPNDLVSVKECHIDNIREYIIKIL